MPLDPDVKTHPEFKCFDDACRHTFGSHKQEGKGGRCFVLRCPCQRFWRREDARREAAREREPGELPRALMDSIVANARLIET